MRPSQTDFEDLIDSLSSKTFVNVLTVTRPVLDYDTHLEIEFYSDKEFQQLITSMLSTSPDQRGYMVVSHNGSILDFPSTGLDSSYNNNDVIIDANHYTPNDEVFFVRYRWTYTNNYNSVIYTDYQSFIHPSTLSLADHLKKSLLYVDGETVVKDTSNVITSIGVSAINSNIVITGDEIATISYVDGKEVSIDELTINKTTTGSPSGKLQAIAVINQNQSGEAAYTWTGPLSTYTSLSSATRQDPTITYFVTDDHTDTEGVIGSYPLLTSKPQINGVELVGNISTSVFNLETLSNKVSNMAENYDAYHYPTCKAVSLFVSQTHDWTPEEYFIYTPFEGTKTCNIDGINDSLITDAFIDVVMPEFIYGYNVTGVNGNIFASAKIRKIKFNNSQYLTACTPNSSVIEIDATAITNTTLPASAFALLYNLEHITLPSAIDVLSDSCFRGCSSITEFQHIGAKHIEPYCFSSCTSLSSIDIQTAITFGINSILDCPNIQALVLPSISAFNCGTGTGVGLDMHAPIKILDFPSAVSFSLGLTRAMYPFIQSLSGLTTINLPSLISGDAYDLDARFYHLDPSVSVFVPSITSASYSLFSHSSANYLFGEDRLSHILISQSFEGLLFYPRNYWEDTSPLVNDEGVYVSIPCYPYDPTSSQWEYIDPLFQYNINNKSVTIKGFDQTYPSSGFYLYNPIGNHGIKDGSLVELHDDGVIETIKDVYDNYISRLPDNWFITQDNGNGTCTLTQMDSTIVPTSAFDVIVPDYIGGLRVTDIGTCFNTNSAFIGITSKAEVCKIRSFACNASSIGAISLNTNITLRDVSLPCLRVFGTEFNNNSFTLANNPNLSSIHLPLIDTIPPAAIRDNTNLKTIFLPSLTSIGANSLVQNSLTAVYLGDTRPTVGSGYNSALQWRYPYGTWNDISNLGGKVCAPYTPSFEQLPFIGLDGIQNQISSNTAGISALSANPVLYAGIFSSTPIDIPIAHNTQYEFRVSGDRTATIILPNAAPASGHVEIFIDVIANSTLTIDWGTVSFLNQSDTLLTTGLWCAKYYPRFGRWVLDLAYWGYVSSSGAILPTYNNEVQVLPPYP